MTKNRIKNIFENINITHDDTVYLHYPLLILTVITLITWLLGGFSTMIWVTLILSTYLILAVQFHLYRSSQKDLEKQQKKIQAYFSLYSMMDFNDPLPYMTGWAATPELALIVLDEIRNNKPDNVVEIGSGISTVIASHGLKELGKGTLMSLDHDKEYAEQTRKQLKKHQVDDVAEIKYSPLVNYKIDESNWQWYDIETLKIPSKIDLLLVDGPPVKTNSYARFPALPLLAEYLGDKATIILHDAHRKSETGIINKWKDQFPEFSIEIRNTEKGIAILRR